jgi:hypothetical protein
MSHRVTSHFAAAVVAFAFSLYLNVSETSGGFIELGGNNDNGSNDNADEGMSNAVNKL